MSGFEVKIERLRRRLTQWELGKKCDIPPYIISRYEQGHVDLKPEELAKIRKALRPSAGDAA